MANDNRRSMKICCGVTAAFFLILAIVIISLAFTVFKIRDPELIVLPVGIDQMKFTGVLTMKSVNFTLGMLLSITNHNYGSFKFQNSTASVDYHGQTIGEVPIPGNFVPARTQINISTHADIMANKLLANPNLTTDLLHGSLNFSSSSVLGGKVGMLKVFHKHGTVSSTCEMSIFIIHPGAQSKCKSKLKL